MRVVCKLILVVMDQTIFFVQLDSYKTWFVASTEVNVFNINVPRIYEKVALRNQKHYVQAHYNDNNSRIQELR